MTSVILFPREQCLAISLLDCFVWIALTTWWCLYNKMYIQCVNFLVWYLIFLILSFNKVQICSFLYSCCPSGLHHYSSFLCWIINFWWKTRSINIAILITNNKLLKYQFCPISCRPNMESGFVFFSALWATVTMMFLSFQLQHLLLCRSFMQKKMDTQLSAATTLSASSRRTGYKSFTVKLLVVKFDVF